MRSEKLYGLGRRWLERGGVGEGDLRFERVARTERGAHAKARRCEGWWERGLNGDGPAPLRGAMLFGVFSGGIARDLARPPATSRHPQGMRGERACWEKVSHAKARRAGGERAGRRTPCAEGAVILPAVQSLRLACMEGASSENAELGLSAPWGGLGERGSREGAKGFWREGV